MGSRMVERILYATIIVSLLVSPNGFLLELFSERFETLPVQCLGGEKQLITSWTTHLLLEILIREMFSPYLY